MGWEKGMSSEAAKARLVIFGVADLGTKYNASLLSSRLEFI